MRWQSLIWWTVSRSWKVVGCWDPPATVWSLGVRGQDGRERRRTDQLRRVGRVDQITRNPVVLVVRIAGRALRTGCCNARACKEAHLGPSRLRKYERQIRGCQSVTVSIPERTSMGYLDVLICGQPTSRHRNDAVTPRTSSMLSMNQITDSGR